MDVETFLCQSRKKISFSKINLLNLRKNLVGPWGSTQLGERSPKPVSPPKSDTRKVSPPSSPQNRPTCTCSTLPRASARTPPLSVCPLDDLAPFISLSFGCKLSPSPLLLEGGLTRKGRVPCFGVWIIEFIIQLNEELFERMAEGHAGPSNDAGRRAPRCE